MWRVDAGTLGVGVRDVTVACLDVAVMDRAARIPAVPIPSEMDPAASPKVTTIPPALDASADRPQTGDVPAVNYRDDSARVLLGDCARLNEFDADLGANLII